MAMTTEIKENIFALYWKQNVRRYKPTYGSHKTTIVNGQSFQGALLLKNLSNITNDDIIEVCVINGDTLPENKELIDEDGIQSAKEDIISSFKPWDGNGNGFIECRNVCHIIDFLRSRSYALPAMGFSVDQLVEEGIFQLI